MKSLKVVGARDEGLGRPTIMDRTLAQTHGVPYVHLAVFCIDVDRVKDARGDEDDLPFGWEIAIVEQYVFTHFDAARDDHRLLVEDACLSVLDGAPGEMKLGSQLPFAVYDLVRRGIWPETMLSAFKQWKKKPDKMLKDLEPLLINAPKEVGKLAKVCLAEKINPPPAPPTREAWGRMVLQGAIS